jgi:hypothetical protein
MESEYGAKASETLPDTEWLALAGQMGWVVLTKDAAIRRNPLEREVVEAERVKMFVITKAGLTADEQLDRILPNLHRIALRAAKPGPFIHGLYPTGIRQLWPEADSP